jgi:predicted phosphoribosyltransferase
MLFHNRLAAGQQLATALVEYRSQPDVVILALPRGGVPVAFEVSQALHAPLDVFLVRKLGVPGREELAMGAIASGGIRVLNEEVIWALQIPDSVIDEVAAVEQREMERREREYRGDRPALDVRGRRVILIDDGLATGSSMRAAVAALRLKEPVRIVVAVPVGAASTCEAIRTVADDVVCVQTPEPFGAVGLWYDDFSQTTDEGVRDLLSRTAPLSHELSL